MQDTIQHSNPVAADQQFVAALEQGRNTLVAHANPLQFGEISTASTLQVQRENDMFAGQLAGVTRTMTNHNMSSRAVEALSEQVVRTQNSFRRAPVQQPAIAAEPKFTGSLSMDDMLAAPQKAPTGPAAFQTAFAVAQTPVAKVSTSSTFQPGIVLSDSGKLPLLARFLKGVGIDRTDMLGFSPPDAKFLDVVPVGNASFVRQTSSTSISAGTPSTLALTPPSAQPRLEAKAQETLDFAQREHVFAARQPRGPIQTGPSMGMR